VKRASFTIFSLLNLYALYLALTTNLALNNLIFGAGVAVIVYMLIRPGTRQDLTLSQLPLAILGAAQYTIYVIIDVIKSGVNVTRIILSPTLPIRPGIIAIKSGMRGEFATALSAHAITITPGEMVVEIGDGGIMYTHCLDAVKSGEDAAAAQAIRRDMLAKIFPNEGADHQEAGHAA
jgi:multicomponent Na+:H+ antiporter subunit E